MADRGAAARRHGDDWDPAFIRRFLPVLDVLLRYFDPEIRGFGNLPESGPFLVVGNHSGGIYMPDFWAFLRRWWHERGPDAPIRALGLDFAFALPGLGAFARRIGSVPASPERAAAVLRSGTPVIVYPGGDGDDYRPWTERHRVDLCGHTGFVRLALREQVPVVPMVAHGSHDAIVVLTRGEALAKTLGLGRLRINVLPIVAGLPWGIAPAQFPTWPLPAKVVVHISEPIDWTHLGPAAADDPEIVQHCYEEVLGRMQSDLDELVRELPNPVLSRVGHVIASGPKALLSGPKALFSRMREW